MEESKKKRRRTMIPPAHLEKLEELFKSEPWPSRIKKYKLATELSQSEQFVSIWFQNRRARMKKEEPFLRFSKHQSNIDNTSNQYATNLTAISRTPSTTDNQIPAKNEHCHGVSIISKPCILKQGPVKNEEHTSTLEVKDRPINIIHSKSILNTGQTFKIIKRPMKIFIKPKEEMKMDTESSVEVAQEQPRNENSALTINNQDRRDENVVKCEVQVTKLFVNNVFTSRPILDNEL